MGRKKNLCPLCCHDSSYKGIPPPKGKEWSQQPGPALGTPVRPPLNILYPHSYIILFLCFSVQLPFFLSCPCPLFWECIPFYFFIFSYFNKSSACLALFVWLCTSWNAFLVIQEPPFSPVTKLSTTHNITVSFLVFYFIFIS